MMRRTAGLLLLFILTGLPYPAEDSFFGEDKAKHFLTSACLTGMLGYAAIRNGTMNADRILVTGCSLTIGLGLLKEIRDARHSNNHFCFQDLFWDIAGISIGALHLKMAPSR